MTSRSPMRQGTSACCACWLIPGTKRVRRASCGRCSWSGTTGARTKALAAVLGHAGTVRRGLLPARHDWRASPAAAGGHARPAVAPRGGVRRGCRLGVGRRTAGSGACSPRGAARRAAAGTRGGCPVDGLRRPTRFSERAVYHLFVLAWRLGFAGRGRRGGRRRGRRAAGRRAGPRAAGGAGRSWLPRRERQAA